MLAGAAVLVAVDRHRRRGRHVRREASDAGRTRTPPANTATVEKGKLSAMVSLNGTLTYRARSDGSPYAVINQARGTYTELPDDGDKVDCGGVFYRVDDKPVLLLCGTVPAYRDLHEGERATTSVSSTRTLCTSATPPRSARPVLTTPSPRRRRGAGGAAADKGVDGPERSTSVRRCSCPSSVRIAQVTGELGSDPPSRGRRCAGDIRHARGAG